MEKLTIQEIAKILVEKNKLTPKEANQFVAIMFEVIQQQLDTDGLVKIKGLGTFKVIRVEARESVSVRTGERVTIDSHAKITFTPDAAMKDLVNKPFSQFETVILNDGVEFEDLSENEIEENTVVEENIIQIAAEEPPIVDEKPIVPPSVEIEQDEPIVAEEEKQDILDDEEEFEFDDETRNGSWKKTLCYILLTLILMAASAYGGYWYGQQTAIPMVETLEDQEDIFDTEETDSIEVVDVDSVDVTEIPQADQAVSEKKEELQTSETEEEPFWKKYEAMDVRVRTGAYHIIGTDHEVKVKPGETLARIARRELGEGMSCYIEVYNDLKANAELQEGQVIKIPKLKWKKTRP